jgi:ABC-type transport system involved in cytochrome c biogenesis permease subunit
MQTSIELLRILLPIAYALAEVCYLSLFLRDDALARRLATPLLLLAVVLHALFIVLRGIAMARHPIGSPLEALTILAFAVALVHLIVELTHKNQGAGVFVIGVVFVFQLVASTFMELFEAPPRLEILLQSPLFGLHTGTAILGYSGFAVSAAYGLLFLLLYRELKASRFGRIYERLPSLDLLASMTVRAAGVGLFFLTIAMIAGIVWSVRLDYDVFRDPKFVTTVILWVVYGACIGAHYLLGWHERRVIYFSLIGFLIMLFSLAAVHVLFRSFHSFA